MRFAAGRLTRLSSAGAQWLRRGVIRHSYRDFGSSLPTKKTPERKNYRLSNVSPEKRQQDLVDAGFVEYPRIARVPTSIGQFKRRWMNRLNTGETADDEYTVNGRVFAIRSAGSKLCFVDLVSQPGEVRLQMAVQEGKLAAEAATTGAVRKFMKLIRSGDHISVTGKPYVTDSGDLSILATSIPTIMSPCLHPIPTSKAADISEALDRHVQLLATPSIMDTIVARTHLIEGIENFLKGRGFRRVYTPILAASAGGATARPFKTTATEFSDRELTLRISPELWLKRLIVGGMDRIFEIGPSFRNEGLDKTHNPEFTTCEFYASNWPLERLILETQTMINDVAGQVETLNHEFHSRIGKWPGPLWPQLDFLPAINKALDIELPDLSLPSARDQILQIFEQKGLPLPTTPTLPRLLDELSSIYLEPRCSSATWIVNIPECLSPLAKSFPHPDLPYQRVAARGELFIQGKEVVNCYEEENSPVEQKRKFIDQQRHARLPKDGETTEDIDDEAMSIDDDYIRCLEWGLPPTGGWGCGIDRLLMLMLNKSNIKDVLTFGNLRAVTRGAEKVPSSLSREVEDPVEEARNVFVGSGESKAPSEQDNAAKSNQKTNVEMHRKDRELRQKRLQEELETKFKAFRL